MRTHICIGAFIVALGNSGCIQAPTSFRTTDSGCATCADANDTSNSPHDAASSGDTASDSALADADAMDSTWGDTSPADFGADSVVDAAVADVADAADMPVDLGGGGLYRIPLTVDNTRVAGTIRNFPVLVQATNDDLRTSARDERQIGFTADDGTPLAHEIERFLPYEGRITAWVLLPVVEGSVDTQFFVTISETPTANVRATEVWNGYAGVWHLMAASGSTAALDSSGSGNDATLVGLTSAAGIDDGKLGGALELDGVDDRLEVADQSALRPATFYISAWVQTSGQAAGSANIFSKPARSVSATNNDSWQMYLDSAQNLRSVTSHAGVPTGHSSTVLPPQTWTYVGLMFDGTTLRHFVNGQAVGEWAEPAAIDYDSDPVLFGAEMDGGSVIAHFAGALDEVRVSTMPRGAGWVATEYANQSDPQAFVTWGALELVAAANP